MTNYDYLMSHLTVRQMSEILANSFNFIWNSFEKTESAFNKWANRKGDGCYMGNVWDPENEKIPNPYVFSQVHDIESDKWIPYGHGPIVSFQIFLEDEFNAEDWK